MSDAREWATAALDAGAFEALAKTLPASSIWSVLLEVMDRRAAARSPADLASQHTRDRFTAPAAVGQRELVALDAELLASVPAFEAIELSPLAPLGACSVIAPTSQRRVISALRGTEVVADPTNVLALECARRLRAHPLEVVRLATSHRCVRAQPAPKGPGFAQHFRLFCLASAGREQKDQNVLAGELARHITAHLSALERLRQVGYPLPASGVRLLARPDRRDAAERVRALLSGEVGNVDSLDHEYYDGLRFTITVGPPDGSGIPLVDGGIFDWVGRLTSNLKHVFVASGMGSQLIAQRYPLRREGARD